LLLDLGLPECRGLETLDRIRNENERLPIIVLTGLSDEATALCSLDHGAQDYLVKGTVTSEALVHSIRYAIQRQQLVQELGRAKRLLEKKNRRLARLYKTAHRFVDNVSHEFRTPLTVIKEYTSLLREGLIGAVNQQQCEMLDVVGDRADDLNNMVDDMLDISRLESGMLGLWRKSCNVEQVVAGIRPALERKAAIKGLTLNFDIAQPLPQVYCDDEKVVRVLINLTINAIKFSAQAGSIRVWATADTKSPDVLIGVTDNGPGISQDLLAKIFARFRQFDMDRRPDCKGFGLGLSIAKELVELNFGEMRVESVPGRGSTFSFTLPPADPLEIVRRYLSRIQHTRNGTSEVSIVEATVDPETDAATAEDVATYLNGLLRRNDLLFQPNHGRWLLILSSSDLELDKFLTRAASALTELNRNRLRGPLPEIEFNTKGTWRTKNRTGELLETLQELLEEREAVHA
jgi:signal transduction histidine kinase